MKLFGYELSLRKEAPPVVSAARPNYAGWFWGGAQEWFAGAWQKNITPDKRENLLAFSAVYACVSLIAEDIAKLRLKLVERKPSGIWEEVERNSRHVLVIRKPNAWQTRIQFYAYWVVMKLLYGNTYVLKQRDNNGIVRALYVLDSRFVTPLVTASGEVLYDIKNDSLSKLAQQIVVPASEIIHDRGLTLFHPLVGVSPIFACGASATQGIRIQNNSATFFENMSRPSGMLTSDGEITDATAVRLKEEFERNFSGSNLGRLLVAGDGLKYSPIALSAEDAQLIEQLRWTVEDVARCFRVPLHKIASGVNPTFNNVSALNQDYYTQTLQSHIEGIEVLLEEGLGLVDVADKQYSVEFDLEGLLRMDPATRADVAQKQVGAGVLSPNEARLRENLAPVAGGDTPYLQVQNYSLAALAARDAMNPLAVPATSPASEPEDEIEDDTEEEDTSGDEAEDAAEEEAARGLAEVLIAKFTELANEFNTARA